jgi:CheY-like chemotaxis protein
MASGDVKRTAVLIDDDADDLELLGETILILDPTTFCIKFQHPVEAMNILTAQELLFPDYIFIDINMPAMNGADCLAGLRRLSRYNRTIITMLSTSVRGPDEKALIYLGANHVFQKPDEYAQLRHIVAKVLAAKSVY